MKKEEFYESLKKILEGNFSLEIVEKGPLHVPIAFEDLTVNINKDINMNGKIKSLMGLLITLTAKAVFKNDTRDKYSIQDMIYIQNCLLNKYYKETYKSTLPFNEENSELILNYLDNLFQQYF